jgi:hypothetical protein
MDKLETPPVPGGEPRVKTTRLCVAHRRNTQLAWISA